MRRAQEVQSNCEWDVRELVGIGQQSAPKIMTTQPTKLRRKSISRVARDEDVHPGTVYRWLNDGILDRAGNRVRLVHSKRGGRVVTDILT